MSQRDLGLIRTIGTRGLATSIINAIILGFCAVVGISATVYLVQSRAAPAIAKS